MEIVAIIDDYLDEEENERALRRPKIVRPRPDFLTTYDDFDFRRRYRLSKTTVHRVCTLIKDDISSTTTRNNAVSCMVQLLLTLRYLATASYLMAAGDLSGVSQSSACRIVQRVIEAIARLRPRFVKFPANKENIIQGFYEKARFPRVIGAIDCTHINIKSPGGPTAENYRNRKGVFSMNVQAVCDSNLVIMDIVARWPGSCHDQTIFNNSALKQKFENGDLGHFFLLGDNGYENKRYILTPYLNPNTAVENLYNQAHIRTRNAVECCFGVLKNRFPVLRKQITLSLQRVQPIVVACAVLHNLAIDEKDPDFGVFLEEPETPEQRAIRLQYENYLAAPTAAGRIRDPRLPLLEYFATLLQ